jgi:hypothetical protein
VSSTAETQRPAITPIELPNVSYGPFRLFEAVPWLMLATSFRFLAPQTVGTMLTMHTLSGVCIFLAFLLATRRMIEFSGGRAPFGTLDFDEQLELARDVLWRIVVLIFVAGMLAAATVSPLAGGSLLWGIDGIAFDPVNLIATAWSSLLAAIILLMIVGAGQASPSGRVPVIDAIRAMRHRHGAPAVSKTSGHVTLFGAMRELAVRCRHMAPAVVAVVLIHVTLSAVQGRVRVVESAFWATNAPGMVKQTVYFVFVFGFASVRLWATLATLIFALRRSYRATAARAAANPARS